MAQYETTDEARAKQLFCEELHRRYGMTLVPDDIPDDENAGWRAIAKLMLNGLWGKLSQGDYPQVEFCDIPRYDEILRDVITGRVELRSMRDLAGRLVEVVYNDLTGSQQAYNKSNPMIGAAITAYGRLLLMKELGKPCNKGRIAYCDTDSLTIFGPPSGPWPERGCFLGDYELEAKNIVKFYAHSAKSYARLELDDENLDENGQPRMKVVVKIKGFSRNFENNELFTIKTLEDLVLDRVDEFTATYFGMTRTRVNANERAIIVNDHKKCIKKLTSSAKKRIVLDDFSTIPFY